ncbi:MAG TPA: penicillin-binding protein activator LpoB [Balneolales bacterium]|nr:penicillin-binding protein activator LpoB [Balneolales bacterium]
MKTINHYLLLLFIALLAACGPTQKVERVSPDTTTDLSGRWNDTDARLVAQTMIKDVLGSPWLERFRKNHDGKNPVVIVGPVRNESMEHIDTEVFTTDLERELINSGEVRFVADPQQREAIRKERMDQQSYSSYDTAKRLAQEVGADFMLIGNVNSIVDQSLSRKTSTIFYDTNLELVNIETNEKAWIGNKKIKKVIKRGIFRG